MATDVIMPQMGESIAEGTVTKWLKKVGEHVDRDEELLEISTDKVDTVIPSPAEGVITEIKVPEGETVPINTVIAILDGPSADSGEKAPSPEGEAEAPPKESGDTAADARTADPEAPAPEPAEAMATEKPAIPVVESPVASEPAAADAKAAASPARADRPAKPLSPVDGSSSRALTSPLVKRIARQEGVDLGALRGTGMGGRVTRSDILQYIEEKKRGGAAEPQAGGGGAATPAPLPAWQAEVREGDRVEKMTQMRRLIAEHMTYSKRTSPHVYTMFEFDMTNIVEIRKREKASFEKTAGTKLTYMPFVARAAIHALQRNPVVNASVRGDEVVYHKHVNLAIAVAIETGLIVPVVKRAEELSFVGLARAINDLAERARTKKLTPDDVTEGTFTITNPGVFGSLIGFAVINQPQVGILDMGAIVKRPVVIEADGQDTIGIRSMQLMSISYDHRIVDGASADHFMNDLRDYLHDWDQPLI